MMAHVLPKIMLGATRIPSSPLPESLSGKPEGALFPYGRERGVVKRGLWTQAKRSSSPAPQLTRSDTGQVTLFCASFQKRGCRMPSTLQSCGENPLR